MLATQKPVISKSTVQTKFQKTALPMFYLIQLLGYNIQI